MPVAPLFHVLGSLVLFGCAVAGCVAAGILFVLFGPVPVNRRVTMVSRVRPMPAAADPILIDPAAFGAQPAFAVEPPPAPSPQPTAFAVEQPAFAAPTAPPIIRQDATPQRPAARSDATSHRAAARKDPTSHRAAVRKDPTPQRPAARSPRATQPPPLPASARRRPAAAVAPIAPVVMRTPSPGPAPLPRSRAARGTEMRHQQFREDERTDTAAVFRTDEMTHVDGVG